MMKALILLLALFPQEESPHRHIPTKPYPVPDWIQDPRLRSLIEEEMGKGTLEQLLPRGKDRERMLRWMKAHLEKGGSRDPKEIAKKLLGENPSLLKGFRTPGQQKNLSRLLNRIQKAYMEAGGDPSRIFGPDFEFPDLSGRPVLSSRGTEWMNRILGDIDWSETLNKSIGDSMVSLEEALARWYKSDRSPIRPPTRNPRKRNPRSGATTGSSSGSGTGSMIPDLDIVPDGEASSAWLWVFMALMATGLVAYMIWTGRRIGKNSSGRRRRKIWVRPEPPARFATPEAFFEYYRELHRFLLQRDLTGLSHEEIAAACASTTTRDLAVNFEELYYDPRGRRELHDLHELCRRALEEPKA